MLWLTVPDATTSIPSSNWGYLAGSTDETTIKNSLDAAPISSSTLFVADGLGPLPLIRNDQSVIFHEGKLHVALSGRTDTSDPKTERALVARQEEDGSWILLGGDEGARYEANNGQRRVINAIFSFEGSLYVQYIESIVVSNTETDRIQRVARYDEDTDSWDDLTGETRGLHYDQGWHTGPVNSGFTTPSSTSFAVIAGELYVLFIENEKFGTGTSALQNPLVASKLDGSSFSRVHEFNPGQTQVELYRSVVLDDVFYVYLRSGSGLSVYTYIWAFDGTSWSQVATDSGPNLSLFEGTVFDTPYFYAENGNLYTMYFSSSWVIKIRESTDGGVTWAQVENIANPGGYYSYSNPRLIGGIVYCLGAKQNTFANQPVDFNLLRLDGSSWTVLGGGTPRLGSDRNAYAYPSSLHFLNGAPYISFYQTTHFDSGGNGAVIDPELYLAWTAP